MPLLTIVALVSTYFFRKTGHVYVGAFLCAMFSAWVIVAGQARRIIRSSADLRRLDG